MTWTRYQANNHGTGNAAGGGTNNRNVVYLAASNVIKAYSILDGSTLWTTAGITVQSWGGKALSLDGHLLYAYGNSAVHAVYTSSGATAWSQGISSTTEGGVAIDTTYNRLYLGDAAGNVYSLNGADGTPVWVTTPFSVITQTPTVLDDHNLAIAATVPGGVYALVKLNYTDGSALCSAAVATYPHYSHVVCDSGGNLIVTGRDRTYSYDSSCSLQWTISSTWETTPAIGSDGKIYAPVVTAAGSVGSLNCFATNGTTLWSSDPITIFTESPALSPDQAHVYITSVYSGLVCINTADGTTDWMASMSGARTAITAPSVDNAGYIYVVKEIGGNTGFMKVSPAGAAEWFAAEGANSEDAPLIDSSGETPTPGPTPAKTRIRVKIMAT